MHFSIFMSSEMTARFDRGGDAAAKDFTWIINMYYFILTCLYFIAAILYNI